MFAVSSALVRTPALRHGLQMMRAPVAARQISMKVVTTSANESTISETASERNRRLGRAMSPHLTIYKPQLTTILSITHRGTGVALAAITWSLGLGALVASHDISAYVTMIEGLQLGDPTIQALKFILAFPVAYHTCNGVRHLAWDLGRFLKIKEVYTTGYAMLASSVILTAVLAML